MPGTWSQILLHVVFSTKMRSPQINPGIAPRLHAFIGGIVRDEKGTLHAIGGMPDHVHLLIQWRTDDSIANLMRNVKSRSSKWIHETYPALQTFARREGYAVFSVSKSSESDVKAYIENQAAHHQRRDFMDELLSMLRLHDVAFDACYLFD